MRRRKGVDGFFLFMIARAWRLAFEGNEENMKRAITCLGVLGVVDFARSCLFFSVT